MKRRFSWFYFMIIAILLAVFSFAVYKVFTIQHGYSSAKETYNDIQGYNNYDQNSAVITEEPDIIDDEDEYYIERDPEISPVSTDFKKLRSEVNNEIIAWLYCPDTVINYPITQHSDNEYYLDHDAKGGYSLNGSLFLQSTNRPDFSDKNSIIHGHHMRDGSMLASLEYWTSQEYLEKHPVMYLNTVAAGNFRLEIVAAFTTPAAGTAYEMSFQTETEFQDWLAWVGEQTKIHSGVEVRYTDRFITLSTCAYSYTDARSCVICKLVPIN